MLWPTRYLCDVLEEMRTCVKTLRFDVMPGLIEELQTLGNRMESALEEKKNLENMHEELKELRKDKKKLEKEIKGLEETKEDLSGK